MASSRFDDAGRTRAAWLALALAGLAAAALILWLNRGTTFFVDELVWFTDLGRDDSLRSVFVPHNGHLHGTTRTIYLLAMSTVGTHYVIFRILGVMSVLLCSALFFQYARRRIGDAAALVPAILLLFYGSAWQHIVVPIGFTVLFSIAMGLAALLAIDRDDRRGDVLACVFVCMSLFTFSVGLPFLVAVAIATLMRPDRLRRAWVFLVPLVLYASWWLWALQFDQGRAEASSITGIPRFFAESLAVVCQSLVGLKSNSAGHPSAIGWVLAALFVLALAWRLRRGDVPRSLYASLGVLGTYWLAAALTQGSGPFAGAAGAVRFIYPGTIGVLLVAADAARGLKIPRAAIAAVVLVGGFGLVGNIRHLDEGADYFRSYSIGMRSYLAMLELGNGSEPGMQRGGAPNPRPQLADSIPYVAAFGADPDGYLAAVSRYGSPAFTLAELRIEPDPVRSGADDALVQTYGLTLTPSPAPRTRRRCHKAESSGGLILPAGGALLRADGADPAGLSLGRFGPAPGKSVGTLDPGSWTRLAIPTDPAQEPWNAYLSVPYTITACPLD